MLYEIVYSGQYIEKNFFLLSIAQNLQGFQQLYNLVQIVMCYHDLILLDVLSFRVGLCFRLRKACVSFLSNVNVLLVKLFAYNMIKYESDAMTEDLLQTPHWIIFRKLESAEILHIWIMAHQLPTGSIYHTNFTSL